MDFLAAEFRKTVEETRAARNGFRRKYPAESRALAVRYCQEQRLTGRSLTTIAMTLGVHLATLRRWLKVEPEPASVPDAKFLPVAMTSPPPVQESAPALSVTLPNGFRVEGLDLSQVVELARSLE